MPNQNLIEAEKIALDLFYTIEKMDLIIPGKTEKELSDEIFELAKLKFGIHKYWHKRIVRSGINTLVPYSENPPNLTIQEDDILFIDFGPILEQWEADLGRTYVIGTNPIKIKIKEDVEIIWYKAKNWFDNQENVTGTEFWLFIYNLIKIEYEYELGSDIAGHQIGIFPHENIASDNINSYIHLKNNNFLKNKKKKEENEWILEIHIIHPVLQIGAFFEQLLT